jgi:hypothetical protein
MDRMLSLAWEGPLACVWRIMDRKPGGRARGRRVLQSISGCIGDVSCDYAGVIRLEVLVFMGSRLCREAAVPGKLHLPACASSGPAHRASSVAVPSCVHFKERLGSMRRVHSLTHQRIKSRTFQLTDAQILKAHPSPNPSRHPSPRRAWR